VIHVARDEIVSSVVWTSALGREKVDVFRLPLRHAVQLDGVPARKRESASADGLEAEAGESLLERVH
jgi:hypothetical protein